ncbi:uncharacterized protein LOC135806088 [Sycon ciliatum]|uniref:uncharacterized protein LOC135806088 n=1 Tax=Sycon ciliatum TaxID=27933 RepID=UPI0031F62251
MAGSKDKVDYGQIGPILLAMFSHFFGGMIIFPFVPFMVTDFLDLPRNKVGFYSGFLVSAYHVGVLLGSMMWGSVSDRWGRRPAVLTSMVLMMVFNLFFGFSRSFTWAVLARFLLGLGSAVISVGKTILSESSNNATTARVFSFMGVVSGLGRLFGPAVGGLLSQPAQKFAAMDTPFFREFPYVLPIFVSSSWTLISFVWAVFKLKETLHRPPSAVKLSENEGEEDGESEDIELLRQGVDEEMGDSDKPEEQCQSTRLFPCCGSISFSSCRNPGSGFKRMPDNEVESANKLVLLCRFACSGIRSYIGAFALLRHKTIRHACTLYGMLAFVGIMHNEVVPLLLVVSFAHGGLCFNTAEIGILTVGFGVFHLIMQLVFYPRLAKRFGYRRVFRGGLSVFFCAILLMPWLTKFTGNQDPAIIFDNSTDTALLYRNHTLPPSGPYYYNESSSLSNNSVVDDVCVRHVPWTPNTTVSACGTTESSNTTSVRSFQFSVIPCLPVSVWMISLFVIVGGYLSRTVSFTSVNVIINNSCEREVRGRVNAIGMVLSSLGRVTGPLVISVLFAWSVSDDHEYPYPLNHHLTFLVMAILALFVMLWSWGLPPSVEIRANSDAKQTNGSPSSAASNNVVVCANGSQIQNTLLLNNLKNGDEQEEKDTAV